MNPASKSLIFINSRFDPESSGCGSLLINNGRNNQLLIPISNHSIDHDGRKQINTLCPEAVCSTLISFPFVKRLRLAGAPSQYNFTNKLRIYSRVAYCKHDRPVWSLIQSTRSLHP